MANARSLSHFNCGQSLILSSLAILAAFRWVLEFLVAKKALFASGPDEILRAVDASDGRVLEFRGFVAI